MIRYTLRCADGHRFESWFKSADDYDSLRGAGHVTCPVCGATQIDKAMMAPSVGQAKSEGSATPPPTEQEKMGRALAKLRTEVERTTEDVGHRFATEARAIHDGAAPDRAIRGAANAKEAKALIDDGIKILPLPYSDPSKAN